MTVCASILILVFLPATPGSAQEPIAPPPAGGNLTPKQQQAEADIFAGRVTPAARGIDPSGIAGMPAGTKPVFLKLEQAYSLSLIRSRAEKAPAAVDRAAILKPEVWAAAAEKVEVADFPRFRREFLAARDPARDGGFRDPSASYLDLCRKLLSVELVQRSVVAHEALYDLYKIYAMNGAASGITQIEVDRTFESLSVAREARSQREREFRDALDEFHVALGLSLGTRLLPDPAEFDGFRRVFTDLDTWSRKLDADSEEISAILDRLPVPTDLVMGGISARHIALSDEKQLDALLAASIKNATDDRTALVARRRVRQLVQAIQLYEREKVSIFVGLRVRKAMLDRTIKPPAEIDADHIRDLASVTHELLLSLAQGREDRDRLVRAWTEAQTCRMALYPLIGVLPYDDWRSFLGSFATTSATAPPKPAPDAAPPASR